MWVSILSPICAIASFVHEQLKRPDMKPILSYPTESVKRTYLTNVI